MAYGYWESNLGPLQEQPVILTTELSFCPGSKNMLTGGAFILGPLRHLPGAQQGCLPCTADSLFLMLSINLTLDSEFDCNSITRTLCR